MPVATQRMRRFAKTLRLDATDGEQKLWRLLRGRRLEGHKFRRQVPVGPYIVDFMCPAAKLIVELDGSQHAEDRRDIKRDAWLTENGYRVLRIWNNELNLNRVGVLEAIWSAVTTLTPHPGAARHPSPARGEGGIEGNAPYRVRGEGDNEEVRDAR